MNLTSGIRNLRRAREIVSVLVFDYGFGQVFDQLDLGRVLPVGRRRGAAAQYVGISGPQRLRLALTALGPTFVKLGQTLSSRPDLLQPAVAAELRRLQDEGPAAEFDQIRGVIETDLGRPLEECFTTFNRQPLSVASLGQVHAAVLPDGREVAVKVLRPGVEEIVHADVQLLADAAHLLASRVPALQHYHLPALIRQFSDQLENQLVYTYEAHNTERLRQSAVEAEMKVRVPEVVWGLTSPRVLTTERIRGHRVDRLPSTVAASERSLLARELGRCMLHQVFVEGVFHGDPHQGNVLVGEDGDLILLDFGIVGYLDPRMRRLLGDLMLDVYSEDMDAIVGTVSQLATIGAGTDLDSLRSDLARLVSRFMILPRRDFPVGELLSRSLRALWLNHVRVPPEISLAAKSLLVAEGVCTDLDPDFDFRDLVQPVIEAARARLLTPSAAATRALKAASSAVRHLGGLPSRIDRLLTRLEQGSLCLRVEDPAAQASQRELPRALNRVALGLLSAALLVAGTVALTASSHPGHLGLGVAAVVGAVLLGLLVLLSVLRPGRL